MFNVLVRELQVSCLDVELIQEDEIDLEEVGGSRCDRRGRTRGRREFDLDFAIDRDRATSLSIANCESQIENGETCSDLITKVKHN